ncbi:hypothetical protein [Pendulispora albinea]|uniref:PEGA domain-containing protein n=1 Tax=Pendulispora albinea TaxID=2741071 RepID=A0ABZ2M5L3_9BACT
MKTHTMQAAFARRRSVSAALIVALTPMLLATPAFAQSDEASTKAARARFQEGVEFYDKKQYENARAAFLQAYALRKHPAVLLNLAQSCLRSGHPMESVKYFQQFMRESTSITPAQRSDAEKGLAEARTKLGRLEISAPTGAEISVDGNVIGTAPLSEAIDVEPATHMIRAKLSDGTTDTKSVTPGPGDKLKILFAPPAEQPAAAPVPAPVPTTPPPSQPPPAAATPPQLDAPPDSGAPGAQITEEPKRDTTTGRMSLVPAYVGFGVGAAGLATAVAFYFFKKSAQDAADEAAADITKNGGTRGTCVSTDPTVIARFGATCNSLRDNNDKVDTNATVGNIALGVGIAGAVFGGVWFFVAKKKNASAEKAPTTGFIRPVPMVFSDTKGFGLEGAF